MSESSRLGIYSSGVVPGEAVVENVNFRIATCENRTVIDRNVVKLFQSASLNNFSALNYSQQSSSILKRQNTL